MSKYLLSLRGVQFGWMHYFFFSDGSIGYAGLRNEQVEYVYVYIFVKKKRKTYLEKSNGCVAAFRLAATFLGPRVDVATWLDALDPAIDGKDSQPLMENHCDLVQPSKKRSTLQGVSLTVSNQRSLTCAEAKLQVRGMETNCDLDRES